MYYLYECIETLILIHSHIYSTDSRILFPREGEFVTQINYENKLNYKQEG